MDHSRYSNFVLVISSHGESGQTEDHNAVNRDYIMTTNGRRVFYDTITSYFTESKCPSLKDKPKLFFIQVLFRKYITNAQHLHWKWPCERTTFSLNMAAWLYIRIDAQMNQQHLDNPVRLKHWPQIMHLLYQSQRCMCGRNLGLISGSRFLTYLNKQSNNNKRRILLMLQTTIYDA